MKSSMPLKMISKRAVLASIALQFSLSIASAAVNGEDPNVQSRSTYETQSSQGTGLQASIPTQPTSNLTESVPVCPTCVANASRQQIAALFSGGSSGSGTRTDQRQ
jgi:hypothetical protein